MQTTRRIPCRSIQAASQTLPTSQYIHYAATPLDSNGACSDEDSMAMSIDNANHGEIWSTHTKFVTKSCIPDDEIYNDFSTVAIQDGANNPDYLADADVLEALESTNHSAVAIPGQLSPATVPETLPM
jgi:hypothetical protein